LEVKFFKAFSLIMYFFLKTLKDFVFLQKFNFLVNKTKQDFL